MLDYYVDIHCHVLPGIDDGAKSLLESKKMLRQGYDDGIREIIVTPHNKGDRDSGKEEIEVKMRELQDWLDQEKISIKMYPGNELLYRHGISNLLEEKKVFTLADSFYVLVEFYPDESFVNIRNGVKEIISSGYIPVIAHIERYDELKNIKRINELHELGALMQVNASTINGKSGYFTKQRMIKLIKKDYISFIASDAHGVQHRRMQLSRSAVVIKRKFGAEVVKRLYYENAKNILSSRKKE